MAFTVPIPVASIELEKEYDPIVFYISIYTIAVFCNQLFAGVAGMSNLDRVVLEEFLFLLQRPR
jgi:hypothetical protein